MIWGLVVVVALVASEFVWANLREWNARRRAVKRGRTLRRNTESPGARSPSGPYRGDQENVITACDIIGAKRQHNPSKQVVYRLPLA